MKVVISVILIALQILYLLLKAHFDGSEDQRKAKEHIAEAQKKLDEIAKQFESRIRFDNMPQDQVDRLLDQMDGNNKK